MGKNNRNVWPFRVGVGLVLALLLGLAWRIHGALHRQRPGVATAREGQATGNTVLRHAKHFTVDYHPDCKVIRVKDPKKPDAKPAVYLLVPRGCKRPDREPDAIVVETPVRRAISLTTVHAPLFLYLGMPQGLVGVAGAKYLHTPELVKQVQQGQLVEVGDGKLTMERNLDLETIRMLEPDLIVASGPANMNTDRNGKLPASGFPVALNLEWLEETPLGRAEWIKFLAAFLDKEAEAEAWFTQVEQGYEAQRKRVQDVGHRPTVMTGMDFRGTWHMSGGRSYVAAFVQDAGGDYLWKDQPSSGSIPLKMEAVLDRAKDADLWLLHMVSVRSRQDMLKMDNRYGLFKAFQTGQLYNNDLKKGPSGGNDFWETGVHRPDLALGDLIAIIHPERAPGHAFHWYRKLPNQVSGQGKP